MAAPCPAEVVLRCVALASGSNGNAIYVEAGDVRLLFDAGLSGRSLERRAAAVGVSLSAVDAVLLSHGHHDHVAGAGVLARRFGLPVLATGGTWKGVGRKLGRIDTLGRFQAGETLTFGGVRVETLPTPHDAPESVAFVVEAEGLRVGVLTDLGHLFSHLVDTFAGLDAAFLESNYDPALLYGGPYPVHLQERIAGPSGHLSNEECADLVTGTANGRLRTVVLSHLSGNCNTPACARLAAAPIDALGIQTYVAPRDRPSAWIEF